MFNLDDSANHYIATRTFNIYIYERGIGDSFNEIISHTWSDVTRFSESSGDGSYAFCGGVNG